MPMTLLWVKWNIIIIVTTKYNLEYHLFIYHFYGNSYGHRSVIASKNVLDIENDAIVKMSYNSNSNYSSTHI